MRSTPPIAPERDRDVQGYETVGLGRRAALRIVAIYCVVGAAWVLFSDRVLDVLVPDPHVRDRLQTVKGAVYVAVTAALLYSLIVRARARFAARELERRGVLDSIVDAIVVTDRAGRVVDVNAAALRLLALPAHEVHGVSLSEFLRRARFQNVDGTPLRVEDSATWRALQGETVGGFECLVQAPDGRVAHVSVSASPVYVTQGEPPHRAVAVIRDVSELKRFEHTREEFLATAAHELKTPLAVVKTYAQLMQRRGQGDLAALGAIDRQVNRLARIVQQLLDVSRLRSGGGELRRDRFDLGQLAQDVADRLQPITVDRIRVLRSDAAVVSADADRIAQVMDNLVENAIRFSPLGGEVEILVTRRGAEGVVSVRDHGVGIPPDRQDRIFERFYRAHAGTSQDYGGLGLGLDVSREIVARHGGRIWFESAPGQGSTFSFTLPLAPGEIAT